MWKVEPWHHYPTKNHYQDTMGTSWNWTSTCLSPYSLPWSSSQIWHLGRYSARRHRPSQWLLSSLPPGSPTRQLWDSAPLKILQSVRSVCSIDVFLVTKSILGSCGRDRWPGEGVQPISPTPSGTSGSTVVTAALMGGTRPPDTLESNKFQGHTQGPTYFLRFYQPATSKTPKQMQSEVKYKEMNYFHDSLLQSE